MESNNGFVSWEKWYSIVGYNFVEQHSTVLQVSSARTRAKSKMQPPSDIVLYSLRLAKDSVSKVIITSSGMNAWTVHEYVSGKCGEMTIGMPDTASRRNRRGSSANRVSTIGPWSSSFRIEAAVGNFPSRWVITTLNGAEVVLRPEANRDNSFITPPVVMQSKNSSASSQGKHGRLGSKVEKRWDTSVSVSPLMVSVWREGKNDGGSAMGGLLSTRTTL